MSSLIARTPFLEGAAALFTDEKIASARSKIIEWLNEAAVGDSKTVVANISKCQELLIHSDAELLEEYLDDILAFSQKNVQDVRRAVIAFIEEICKLHIHLLPRVITILAMFIRDDSPQVQKRVIQGCAAVYRNALKWICSSPEISDEMESAWNTLCLMKAQILDMIDNDNDGIRTNAIKFLEGVVLLQTSPDEDSLKRENDFSLEDIPLTLKIVRRRKLEDEAVNIFDLLIKFHGASHISSVNLIACMGTLCTVAKLRPTFMANVVDAIKNLNSNLPPTLTDSQVNSVKKHMKMQLINILKMPAAFELQPIIVPLLNDLGILNQEIARALPKLDKQEQARRSKRAAENAALAGAQKKQKLDREDTQIRSSSPQIERPMEVDVDEIAEQQNKSTRVNEKFIHENLKSTDLVVSLVMAAMDHLPSEQPPDFFLTNYHPIPNFTLVSVKKKIAELLSAQLTEARIGPGASCISKEPPMRLKVTLEEEKSIIQGVKKTSDLVADMLNKDEQEMNFDKNIEEEEIRKDDPTKKLRETLERVKGEQSIVPKMKQRVKTLKLQEVTKPLSKAAKEEFLQNTIKRILNSEKQCIIGGVAAKRRRIVTVIAASFSAEIRETIISFIVGDLKNRIDLAFAWLYEEYSLLQGFTRHSYIKSENKPEFAYNQLLDQMILGVLEITDSKEKEKLLRKLFLEAPIISDEATKHLVSMCELVELLNCGMELLKDLVIRRPAKQEKFLSVLLRYSVHNNAEIREKAIEHICSLYTEFKIQTEKIENFAVEWLHFLEKTSVPLSMFNRDYGRSDIVNVWTEDLARICLNLFLTLLPYNPELIKHLTQVYTSTTSDMKRIILKSIEMPIRKMGPDCDELLNLIEICPKGAETLITRVVYILTEKTEPTPHLVSKVRDLYTNKVPDVRLLIPVLSGLSRKEILNALPKFLKLNPVIVKEVFNRLLNLGADPTSSQMPITPTELLVALHQIDSKVDLKLVVKATALCLAEKETYTHEVLAVVLQQLVEIVPLPTLLMRTVIQSVTLYPRMANFIVNLLQRLTQKQVWRQKVVWEGFLKCCQRLQPQSLSILMQLQPAQLQDAITICPELKAPLLEQAKAINENQMGHIPPQILDLLMGKEAGVQHHQTAADENSMTSRDSEFDDGNSKISEGGAAKIEDGDSKPPPPPGDE